jgi:hypothetical protein
MPLPDVDTSKLVEAELQRARKAIEEENLGMARVCCRRAVGHAMSGSKEFATGGKTLHTLAYLEILQEHPGIPLEHANAARRLRGKRGEDEPSVISMDPLEDTRIILEYIQGLENSQNTV